ncbi:hypothetical protein MKQ68_14230 [Chitinophaga horti]|uniref:Uncharacterized protein n=1 Tax=Chitinophaga horti TaxID=2920382 RepID=A0ABY6IV52_9BACT|nr:hypothetical protein [Chitinophaga horti]UYQ91248.1 hypothetical protein MKQ68_14230 [Chitinophaga horti]
MKNLFQLLLPATLFAGCQQRENSAREMSEPDTLVVSRPQATAESLIVPGQSAGQLHINGDAAKATRLLGKPDSTDAGMGKLLAVWFSQHHRGDDLTAVYAERNMGVDETARIRMIRVTSPAYATAEGIHTGKSIADVRQHYQLTAEATFTHFDYRYTVFGTNEGIAFEINSDSLLTGIIVRDTGRLAKKGYLPFHPNHTKL